MICFNHCSTSRAVLFKQLILQMARNSKTEKGVLVTSVGVLVCCCAAVFEFTNRAPIKLTLTVPSSAAKCAAAVEIYSTLFCGL